MTPFEYQWMTQTEFDELQANIAEWRRMFL